MTKASLPGHLDSDKEKAKPEHFPKDTGCKRAKKLGYYGLCKDCTFDPCLEEKRAFQIAKKLQRYSAIVDMLRTGKSTKDVAEHFGVCQRTVSRATKEKETKLMSG